MTVVITGANSAVGLAILRCGPTHAPATTLVPAVRSERAADEVRQRAGRTDGIVRISYDDPASLAAAFRDASAVVHLPGVLVERPGSSYEQANVETTRGVVDAATRAGVKKIVLVSAVGASETSPNRYWRTKGQAEALVRASGLGYTVLRAPMVLGEGTEGAAAIKRHASHPRATLIAGGRTRHQPLAVDDLARAALAATQLSVAGNLTLDLVGPVTLTERDMVERAARQLGRDIRIRSVPKGWLSLLLAIRQLAGRPGLSRDALDVITADTDLDARPAVAALGIELTGIDAMIRDSLAGFSRHRSGPAPAH